MKKYNEFVFEKKFDLDRVERILEKSTFHSYKEMQHEILKEYGNQIYFVATFNSAIVSLYPIINQIIVNSNYDIHISAYQVVLLTIFTIAEILHINNEAIFEMRIKLEEMGIINFVKDIKNTLFSIEKIVKVIAKTIGKTISLFTDMLGYVSLLVPINEALIEIVKQDGLNMENLPRKILGLGIGLGIITLKNIVIRILHKLGANKNIIYKVDDVLEMEKVNVYHKMRTREKMK